MMRRVFGNMYRLIQNIYLITVFLFHVQVHRLILCVGVAQLHILIITLYMYVYVLMPTSVEGSITDQALPYKCANMHLNYLF